MENSPEYKAKRLLIVAAQQWQYKAGAKEADGRAAGRRFMARDLALVSG